MWDVHDADTPYILVLCDKDLGLWKILHIRIKGLLAPELSTDEGERLTEEVREELLKKWTKVSVVTYGKSYERWIGTVNLESGEEYLELCLRLMDKLGIEQGGR